MGHVPGNSYTRMNPSFRDTRSTGILAYEVVEDDANMDTHVKARVEVSREGVWLTGGPLTHDQALQLASLVTGLVSEVAEAL